MDYAAPWSLSAQRNVRVSGKYGVACGYDGPHGSASSVDPHVEDLRQAEVDVVIVNALGS